MTHPNIVMISVDALRPDRMNLHGYERPTMPVLDRLARDGAYCADAISTTAFTQPALPSILTSSMPLSHGGYDRGAVGRPDSLFKVLGRNGYKTTLLSTFPWVSGFYGYDEGVQSQNMLFVINALVGVASQTMASTVRRRLAGEIGQADAIDAIRPILHKMFDDLDAYCDHRVAEYEFDKVDLGGERLITDGYDYPKIKRILARHRHDFDNDPPRYILRYFSEVPNAHNWIAQDWRSARHPRPLARSVFRRIAAELMRTASPARARLIEYPNKRYIDAHALTDRVIRTIDTHDTDDPFCVWTHFFDTHVPYCPGVGKNWKTDARTYLRALDYEPDMDISSALKKRPETEQEWAVWRAMYDASMRYVDDQIGRVLNALKTRNLDENTVVVIISDHGEELGEHGDVSHHFRLYEHNIRVPIIFSGPGVPGGRIDGLTTVMDIAPSVAALADIEPDVRWEGTPVFSSDVNARRHVIAEAFHSGNCLFAHRPPYIAVRTDRYKYLWKEYRDVTDKYSSTDPELYEYRNDPDEQNDLYDPDHPALDNLNAIVADRLAEIPEISDARILKAFGGIGETAIRKARHGTPARQESAG